MNGYSSQQEQSLCQHEATEPFYSSSDGPTQQIRSAQSGVSPYLMPQQQAAIGTTAPTGNLMPITPLTQPAPITLSSTEFFNGYLRTQIGKRVRVEFLVGTNTSTDRVGTLLGVGANYILLRPSDSDDVEVCDFFSIKFVTIYH